MLKPMNVNYTGSQNPDSPSSECRTTDLYQNEYITSFVDKWDQLIDWDARAKSEGDFFINVLRSRGVQTILDVATGTGFHSVRMLEAGFDVTSADGSDAMLSRAFDNARERGHLLKTLHADWRWLGQSSSERFDAIVCLGNSFTHLHDELDRRRVLAEFYAALKPAGVLILDQRNYDCMLDVGFKSKHKYYYCGDQVVVQPQIIESNLVQFEYSFPDNSTYTLNLHPLRKDYMRKLTREAGFQRIRTYGDFEATYENDDPDFFIHVAEKSANEKSIPLSSDVSSRALAITEDYYNSDDADAFYSTIWGGEDLHLGIYGEAKDILDASNVTVDTMCTQLSAIDSNTRVIDLGSGYGGSSRRLASRYNCQIVGLNLSETQNDRAVLANAHANLSDLIDIQHGNFEDIPSANDTFDIVWSQDSFLHSRHKDRVIAEAYRVLKPGGVLIFTDPMEASDANSDDLEYIYDRLNLSSMGSIVEYQRLARLVGFVDVEFKDFSDQLPVHFSKIRDELIDKRKLVEESASKEYVENMLSGLQRWIDGGNSGILEWGIHRWLKPPV